jgi:CRISPR-associated protein Csm4
LETETALEEFLEVYRGAEPPLLVSNGLPLGYLPKPVIPPVTQQEIDSVVNKEKDDRIKASHKITIIKKLDIIPKEIWALFKRRPITPSALFSEMYTRYKSIAEFEKGRETVSVQHNTMDRIKGTARRGGLYAQEETFFDPSLASFEIYLRTNYFSRSELYRIIEYMSIEGFGRDSSTGKGHFDFTLNEGIDLPEVENPNAFMTLSSYVPTVKDPVRGFYNVVHKYGKLGGLYAKGVADVYGNPFKVPLIMLAAGSTFFDQDYNKAKVYGGLVKDIHKNKGIKQYAYAFPVGISIEDTHEEV